MTIEVNESIVVKHGNYEAILAWAGTDNIRCQDVHGVFIITPTGDVLAEFGAELVRQQDGTIAIFHPPTNT